MKTIKLSIILLALLTLGQAKAQGLTGSGTTNDPYLISSDANWNTFAQSVTNGTTYAGQTVKLTADITATVMAGVEDKCFAGTFDGQGHTITLNMTATMQFTALFCYADGATFQNLKVDGTINTAKKFCAGLAGAIINNGSTFTNCVSDVTINSTINGDGTHGGFVGYISWGDNTFVGCAFTGKLLGVNTNYVGGFVGYTETNHNATVSFTNCVFHPQQVTMSGYGSQTFARWRSGNSSVFIGDNCYYSQTLGAAQGKQMHSITGDENVTVAFNGEGTAYDMSGISAYSVGLVYDNTLYAGQGETASLNLGCTPPSGYVCSGYTTSAGTLTGTASPYSLTMPNEAVTIQAMLEQLIPVVYYIDENGEEQACASYTVVTDELDFDNLPAGWYVVNDCITLYRQVHFAGNAHLILCDGATMSISSSIPDALYTDGSITLYSQSGGTGSLATTSGLGHGINATNLTINGGTLNATGNNSGIVIGDASGHVTINGGTLTSNEISSPMVTLGWSETTDRITVGNFTYSNTPTVSVKSGKAFQYEDNGETVIVSRTLDEAQIAAIGGKTLVPYSLNPVAYVDGNGTEHTCSYYTVLEGGGSTTLTEGWYVVDDDITYNGLLSLNGDVTLILGNSKTMTIGTNNIGDGGIDQSSNNNGTGNLTVYGQSLSPDEAGTLNATPNRFPQFESDFNVVTATPTGGWHSINVSNYTQHSGNVIAGAESDKAISADSFTINGGSINATSNDYGIFTNGEMIINGGSINTTSNDYGIFTNGEIIINGGSINTTGNNYGIFINGDMIINGGNVTASVNHPFAQWCGLSSQNNIIINGGTVQSDGIYTINNIILGYTKVSDHIHANNYTARDGTVSVKSGQVFCYENGNETVYISNTLTTEEIAAIGGKTLWPYIGPCAPPFNLCLTDIGTTTATLSWMGWTEQYEVMYEAVGEKTTREVSTNNSHSMVITDLTPDTTYEWKVRGVNCDGNGSITEWSETSIFTTLISCYPVNHLSYDNLTSFSVNLSWVLVDETQTGWQICLNGDETNLIEANTNEGFLLDGLTPNVEYTVKVRAYCDENDYSRWSDTVTFTTPEVCFTPKNLATTNITAVSADLSWIGREDVDSYTVRYRTANRTGEWITETTSETEAQLTGLDGGTTYEVQVRSDCNPDGWCNMITFTTLDENTKVFVNEGDWGDDDNWIPVGVPTIDNDVILRSEATVTDIAEANTITIEGTATLTIEDGGQLKVNSDIIATIKKDIVGFGPGNEETDNGFYLIASPATESVAAADAGLVTTNNDYDLYSWNRTATYEEWHNYKKNMFSLSNGTGYLYANQGNMEMSITATLKRSNLPITMTPAYDEQAGGWNLYGNPFPCEAYLSTDDEGVTFYRLIGNEFIPVTGAIAPMEGFFVVATAANQTFTISREATAK